MHPEPTAAATPVALAREGLATLARELDAYLTFWAEAREESRTAAAY